MFFLYLFLIFFISSLIYILFFLASKKESWDYFYGSIFECGFSSYYYSRISFSIHYFIVALTFLFMDLELCVVMPYLNLFAFDFAGMLYSFMIVYILLLGLILEWQSGKLSWVS